LSPRTLVGVGRLNYIPVVTVEIAVFWNVTPFRLVGLWRNLLPVTQVYICPDVSTLLPTVLPSSLTSFCHLFLVLPLNLVSKFIYNALLGILFSSILCTCPNQRNLFNWYTGLHLIEGPQIAHKFFRNKNISKKLKLRLKNTIIDKTLTYASETTFLKGKGIEEF
jgi:hypothetical protein